MTSDCISTNVELVELSKSYQEGEKDIQILESVNYTFQSGKFYVLLGRSGSGKSSLINLISGIDHASSGQIKIGPTVMNELSEYERTVFRRDNIGIVFQFFNLIPTLSVLENVTLPHELSGQSFRKSQEKAKDLLERVGLKERINYSPELLSGGEQQRVAIARALMNDPEIVLADEPTGNLDEETGKTILELLTSVIREENKTMIMATHSQEVIPFADEVLTIHNRKLTPFSQEGAS